MKASATSKQSFWVSGKILHPVPRLGKAPTDSIPFVPTDPNLHLCFKHPLKATNQEQKNPAQHNTAPTRVRKWVSSNRKTGRLSRVRGVGS